MGKSLIIVESPTKIKTLKKFLGSGYLIESSVGHIRDLPEKEFGIDLENNFDPKYVVLSDKKEVIKKLCDAAKKCDIVFLSTDPDREGEAIAWHITQILPPDTVVKRATFNAITKDAVLHGLENPRDIDDALVNAQQARRLLDRIVGYKISPFLNRRMQRGRAGSLSAGRVQSVALMLIVNREKEIEAFKPVEYWNIGTILQTDPSEKNFRAYVYSVDGKRIEKELVEGKDVKLINNEQVAKSVVELLKKAKYKVDSVIKKEKKRNPVPPFITSTLQQEASRHYGFQSTRTMSVAQSLYEGIDLGNEGAEGLITYMRTDSVRTAPEAIDQARDFIKQQYGAEYLPEKGIIYTSKKSAQDAHEAIRPSNLSHPPEMLKPYLNRDQYVLYDLIWKRFIASQMVPAIYDTVSADIITDTGVVLRATGSVMKFAGFLATYEEKSDEDDKDDEARLLPPLTEGQALNLQEVTSEQSFTKPPPRFSEASLIKELEKCGIGRPSTYTSIMNKIQSREYTVKESNRLKPTELGRVIAEMLETNFQKIMSVGFTAEMEDNLELVADNKKEWRTLIKDFWEQFAPTLETAEKEATVPKIPTDLDCPTCGAKLQKVWFRNKYFYGCSRYPECTFSASLEELSFNKDDYAEDFNWEHPCPICSGPMKVRHGRFGAFLGCTKYPDCRGIVNIPKRGEAVIEASEMPACPAVGCDGNMVARKSRFGKTFYSCSTFPSCDVIVNDLSELSVKYPDHPKTAYVKKPRKGRPAKAEKETAVKSSKKGAKKEPKEKKERKPRAMPTMKLSKELAAVVGANEATRGNAIKGVWDYIKANNLQDPADKRRILTDDLLSKLFGTKEPLNMFQLAGVITKHLNK